jgi:hypothetical protein
MAMENYQKIEKIGEGMFSSMIIGSIPRHEAEEGCT